eukprot:TRINITY_DN6104_c2_g1_i1.p1 TRINITY_DN6104_c2_g1~~TRINITY_DN6104_c2_g1_i1.p1  ORF type:complete len:776 (-),score=163.81 TRINITY_DN6104_c2_g1_i1:7-2334(-)
MLSPHMRTLPHIASLPATSIRSLPTHPFASHAAKRLPTSPFLPVACSLSQLSSPRPPSNTTTTTSTTPSTSATTSSLFSTRPRLFGHTAAAADRHQLDRDVQDLRLQRCTEHLEAIPLEMGTLSEERVRTMQEPSALFRTIFLAGHYSAVAHYPVTLHRVPRPLLLHTPHFDTRTARVSTGWAHSVAITRDEILWWGDQAHSGLHADPSSLAKVRTRSHRAPPLRPFVHHVKGEEEDALVDVACGRAHTLFLTESGRVLSCGQGTLGQLGRKSIDEAYSHMWEKKEQLPSYREVVRRRMRRWTCKDKEVKKLDFEDEVVTGSRIAFHRAKNYKYVHFYREYYSPEFPLWEHGCDGRVDYVPLCASPSLAASNKNAARGGKRNDAGERTGGRAQNEQGASRGEHEKRRGKAGGEDSSSADSAPGGVPSSEYLRARLAKQRATAAPSSTASELSPQPGHSPHGRVLSIAAGADHSLALTENGTVLSWGCGLYGATGDANLRHRFAPAPIPSLPRCVAIAGGIDYSAVVTEDGEVYVFGCNEDGNLVPDKAPVIPPTKVQGIPTQVVGVACGGRHILALDVNGGVWAWGEGTSGQLGSGGFESSARPTKLVMPGAAPAVSVHAGTHHSAVVVQHTTYSQKLVLFGNQRDFQLGTGQLSHVSVPRAISVPYDYRVLDVSCGVRQTLMLADLPSYHYEDAMMKYPFAVRRVDRKCLPPLSARRPTNALKERLRRQRYSKLRQAVETEKKRAAALRDTEKRWGAEARERAEKAHKERKALA